MELSRRHFLKRAAVGSAGAVMLTHWSLGQPILPHQEDLSILSNWIRLKDKKNALYNHYYSLAAHHLKERKQTVAQINTQDQWRSRQKEIRKKIIQCIGGKLPLFWTDCK